MLEVLGLDAGYGDFQALFGVDLRIDAAETLALIGANGAGKSTLLRCVTGLIPPWRGEIRFRGRHLAALPAHAIAARGIAMVPEGRQLFPSLTVEENLRVGASSARVGPWTLPRVLDLFPGLAPRLGRRVTTLSGGEQQMVAIGRALLANPDLLLCDEISLGLAPAIVGDLYQTLRTVVAEGVTVLVVEQDMRQALALADRVYCLREGRVVLSGRSDALSQSAIVSAYFGAAA